MVSPHSRAARRARQYGRVLRELSAGALCGGALALGASPARAHDAPLIQRIVWRAETNDVLLLTNRGLIFGDPASKRWRLLCREVLHIPPTEQPGLAALPSGRLLIATSSGLQRSDDDGCSWHTDFGGLLVTALAQDPRRPERIYVATFPLGEASENVSGDSALRVSDDGGESWSSLRVMADNDFPTALRVAPSDSQRIYASGGLYAAAGREFYVVRSRDGGQSWDRFVLPLTLADSNMSVLAISPVDPDVVLVKVTPSEPTTTPERVLISRNGGETFSDAHAVMTLRDAAFSADGSTIWLAGKEGLFRSRDGAASFERVGDGEEMSCAVEHDGALLACGHYDGLDEDGSKNGVGRSLDLGESYTPWMTFQDVTSAVECGASSATTATCATPWSDWSYEVANMFSAASLNRDGGAPLPATDAGASAPDAGSPRDAGTTPAPSGDAAMPSPAHDDGGCNVTSVRGTSHVLAALLLLVLRRRRR